MSIISLKYAGEFTQLSGKVQFFAQPVSQDVTVKEVYERLNELQHAVESLKMQIRREIQH